MNADAVVAVSAAVVALTQLSKWAGLRDTWGPLAVILLSGLGVLVWLVGGEQWPPARTDIWPIFSGWVAVTLTAAGTFGFTRAAVGAVTRATPPPTGPGEQSVESPMTRVPTATEIAEEMLRLRAEQLKARLAEREAAHTLATQPADYDEREARP